MTGRKKMQLRLKQFGCYDQASFSFLDQGCVLISAPSGKGKSTIIRAIQFALFGTGHKLVQYGKKSCSVQLTWKGLVIERTKGPCRLTVQWKGNTYEDAEAQSIVNTVIGTSSSSPFEVSAFLGMSPSDKLGFLESIVTNTVCLDDIKKQLKARIHELESRQSELTGERTSLVHILQELQPTTPLTSDELTEEQAEQQLRQLQQDHDAYVAHERQHSHLAETQSRLEQQRQAIQQHVGGHTIEYVQQLRTQWLQWTTYERLRHDIESEHTTLEEMYKTEQEVHASLVQSMEINERDILRLEHTWRDACALEECREKLDQLVDQTEHLARYQDAILQTEQQLADQYTCPQCQTHLILHEQTLQVKTDQHTTVHDRPYLERRLRQLRQQCIESQKQQTMRLHYIEEEKRYLSNQTMNVPAKELKEQLDKYRDIHRRYNVLQERLKNVQQGIHRLEPKVKQLKSMERPSQQPMYTMNQLDELYNALQRQSILDTEWERNQAALSEWRRQQPPCVTQQQVDEARRVLEACKQQQLRQRFETNVQQVEEKLVSVTTSLEKALLFRTKLAEAETLALQQLIQTINSFVQQYTDVFFESEPLHAFIEVRERAGRSQVVVSVTTHGSHSTDLDCLSTGERDRVALAFTLALQDLLQQPFLLLDECVSSLDQTNADLVFHTIQERHRDQLVILIAHQIVTGMFDQVLYL